MDSLRSSLVPPRLPVNATTIVSAGFRDECPLVVDLDGTLIKTDMLIESALWLFRRAPVQTLLGAPFWLLRGRAAFKRQIARRLDFPVELLPYREELLDYLRKQRASHRRLVLVSAADELLVHKISDYLGLFDQWLGSDGRINLKGKHKRARLVREFGERGFDYIGDSRADLAVWAFARRGLVTSSSRRLRTLAAGRTELIDYPPLRAHSPLAYLRALRAHHWIKNLLVFVPILAAHRINELALVADLAVGFTSFCLLTSGLYVINDLFDLNADRRHPRKQKRPLAAGDIKLRHGLLMAPLLMLASFGLSWVMLPPTLPVLSAYLILTLAYSLWLKQIVLLDVIVLAGLFMIRILAGAIPVGIPLSRWLLGFSLFFFLSLALLKRYTEIMTMQSITGSSTRVRGYRTRDANLILSLGSASGYMSVVVLALYVDTATAERLYTRNELIWLVCPLMLYWISYLWLMAHRNRMPHDPLVFAVRNHTSRTIALLMAALVILAV